MTPTDEQEAIRAAAPRGNTMVSAYAGCAKTTTIELAAGAIKSPALALAFNVSIKKEMAGRLPPNFTVMTMNGLGYGALRRALPNVSFGEPEPRKISKLITRFAKDNKIELLSEQWDIAKQVVTRAMQWGIVPRDEGQKPLSEDNEVTWGLLMDGLGILREDQDFFHHIAYNVLEWNNRLVLDGVVSFDDQVYYSTCIAGKFPLFPHMIVDEAQDLSPLNHAMLELARRPDGKLMIVGDPKQAIYAFRGADSESMARLRELRPTWTDLPLTLTFRCPKLVVTRQQGHAPGFRAAETNRPGSFFDMGREDPLTFERSWTWKDVMGRVGESRSLAIICRNNAPLLSMAFKLLRRRISIKMLGRDIGTGLIALSRKLFPADDMSRDSMLGVLGEWEDHEVDLATANDKLEQADSIRDRAESLRAVISFGEVEDSGRLRQALRALFEREDGQVILSTIHKAKGLEWDAVLHLDPWRIPSKWATEAARHGDKTQLQQEMNLLYVCETRTRDLLLEANIKEMI